MSVSKKLRQDCPSFFLKQVILRKPQESIVTKNWDIVSILLAFSEYMSFIIMDDPLGNFFLFFKQKEELPLSLHLTIKYQQYMTNLTIQY